MKVKINKTEYLKMKALQKKEATLKDCLFLFNTIKYYSLIKRLVTAIPLDTNLMKYIPDAY